MSRLGLRGLRGRLLLALVATSAVTLAVAAAVVLQPLQARLRDQGANNLRSAVLTSRLQFEDAVDLPAATPVQRGRRGDAILDASIDLRDRTGARVLVADPSLTPDPDSGLSAPGFLYDSDFGRGERTAVLVALRTLRVGEMQDEIDGDQLSIGVPLYRGDGGALSGVLVAQRRLTEVTGAVQQVRNALLVAALVGLLVALALGVAVSATLLARLRRLRGIAVRIADEGPGAPITPHDDGRDEVGDLARALGRMQEDLRRQEAARRSFVATASHELRTPLTMLQGTMELLEEDLRDGGDLRDAQQQVASARRELLRLSTLAGELLDLSRLDASVQLRSEPVELGEVARAVAAEFALRADDRDVDVDLRQAAEGCWGRGDPDAVARVVRILLDNALRYAPPGEPVTIETGYEAGGTACVRVSDRGPGIAPEERERVFERFHRGRDATVASGFGLGLAIGRELAERMGGTLALDDRPPGTGARFVLRVPGARPSSRAPSPAPDSAAAT